MVTRAFSSTGRLKRFGAATPRQAERRAQLIGLTASQMSERFGFFGVQALLFLYLDQHLLGGPAAHRVLGLDGLERLLRATLHASGKAEVASVLFGLFTALGYLATLVGGSIADRWLGAPRVILLGGGLALLGYLLLTVESWFLIGLLLVAAGAGAFKGNMTAEIGELYADGDASREWGFRVFFIGVNLGMLLAPLVCGVLGQAHGYRYGFAASALGMFCALLIVTATMRRRGRLAARPAPQRFGWTRRNAAAFAVFFTVLSVTLAGVEQIYNAYIGWAQAHVRIGWNGRSLPTTVLLTADSACTVIMMSLTAWLWRTWRRFRPEPAAWVKIAVGCLLLGAAYACLSAIRDDSDPALGAWLVAFHAINSLAFANISPGALAFLARCAPEGARSTFMSFFYLEFAAGSLLAGGAGRWMDRVPAPVFWGAHALTFILAGCTMILLGRWISTALAPAPAPAVTAAHPTSLAA